jgi:phosphoenolpyruvate carboxykinase (ATP)
VLEDGVTCPAGVFNIEGGCYAKAINLSPSTDPEVFEATNRFGVFLENVSCAPDTRDVDYCDR